MPRVTRRRPPAELAPPTTTNVRAYPTALAWSASGEILAIGDDGGDVHLVFPATGGAQLRTRAHAGPIQSLAWHPRRDALVTTGQDGAVRLWEGPFVEPRELRGPGDTWAEHACFAPGGARLAVAVGAQAHVFEEDRPLATTAAVASTIAALAFTPSGKSLGVACYGGVRLFEPATGRPTRQLDWRGSMLSLAFSPDGSIAACGCQDNSVHFWRIASGVDAQMSGYPAKPRSIAWTHDGRWLATAGDATISLWPFDKRGPEGRAPLQLAAHEDLVTELAAAPLVDLLLSGARDGTVAVWAPPTLTTPVFTTRASARIAQVAWGADGGASVLRWAAADASGLVLVGQV